MADPDLFTAKGTAEVVEWLHKIRDAARAAEAVEQSRDGSVMWGSVALEAGALAAWLKVASGWHRKHRRRRPDGY